MRARDMYLASLLGEPQPNVASTSLESDSGRGILAPSSS
jgi:hypothetical protein